MAEEGKISPEKETEKEKEEEETEGKDSNSVPTAGDEKREKGKGTKGKEEETEGNNPILTPAEGEEGGEEAKEENQANEEADSDSVTVTVAAALPYADAVAGVKADFSMPQLQELEQQTLIYRYLAAAVPVPTHLVFPIWKSVTTSSASAAGPEQFPTLLGLATLCLDFGKSPEPEPGRCRRTDGKKWRCWRNVVPDQKYCERHLHRGRKRPIPVEIIDEPEDALPALPAPPVAGATSASAEKGTAEGSTSSKKSKKERVSKAANDPQVAVPAAAASAVKSS